MKVKPREGLKVLNPDSRLHLPPEGAEVPETSYWLRRLADGDVVLSKEPVVKPIQIPNRE
jgi:hypothetical protein